MGAVGGRGGMNEWVGKGGGGERSCAVVGLGGGEKGGQERK